MKTPENITIIPSHSVHEEELQTQTTYVRYSSTITTPSDANTEDLMNAIEASGTLDFWNEAEEDQYRADDGDAA
jgi:hypothetical protein